MHASPRLGVVAPMPLLSFVVFFGRMCFHKSAVPFTFGAGADNPGSLDVPRAQQTQPVLGMFLSKELPMQGLRPIRSGKFACASGYATCKPNAAVCYTLEPWERSRAAPSGSYNCSAAGVASDAAYPARVIRA